MHDEADEANRVKRAAAIWNESRKDLTDTLASTICGTGGGIQIDTPPSIRFHPSLWHDPTKRFYPALVAWHYPYGARSHCARYPSGFIWIRKPATR